jgi:hypothetical protein
MDLESRLNLEADEAAAAAFLVERGGALARDLEDDGVCWLALHPRRDPEETYYARLAWTAYPHQAPSVKFADCVGGSLTSTSAWPVVPGYRPTSFDICKPFTAEGFALHPDWQAGPTAWPTTGNPLLWVVETLQEDLDTSYGGRAA